MPSPGAVCPAIIEFPLNINVDFKLIIPETSKTTIRPALLTASRKDPTPESFKLVT